MIRANQGLVLAKLEDTYGTDPTPTVAANAILTKGMPSWEIVSQARQREVPLGYMGELAPVNVGEAFKLSFVVELKGSGAAGTASRYGALLRACGLTETVSAGVSVTYANNSTLDNESVTLWFYRGLILHKLTGCRGNVSFTFQAGEIIQASFEFWGLYTGPASITDVSFPSPTHETVAPLIAKAGNFVYNSVSTLVIEQLTLDLGNTVVPRKDVNASTGGVGSYVITQRAVKGTMNPEVVAKSTLDVWTLFDASTAANLEFKPTGTAGNLLELTVTGVVLEVPAYGDRENINVHDLNFGVHPTLSTGNAEVSLVFK